LTTPVKKRCPSSGQPNENQAPFAEFLRPPRPVTPGPGQTVNVLRPGGKGRPRSARREARKSRGSRWRWTWNCEVSRDPCPPTGTLPALPPPKTGHTNDMSRRDGFPGPRRKPWLPDRAPQVTNGDSLPPGILGTRCRREPDEVACPGASTPQPANYLKAVFRGGTPEAARAWKRGRAPTVAAPP